MALVPHNKAVNPTSRGAGHNRPPLLKQGRDRHRQFSTTADDSALVNQIMLTDKSHDHPYEVPPLAVTQILQTIEAILSRVTKPEIHDGILVPGALAPAATHVDALEHEKTLHANLSTLHDSVDVPRSVFNAIHSKLMCTFVQGEDANKTTMDILDIVQHYDWDEKVVLALGAFAIKDGEFWLVAQQYTTNPLARAVGQLKQLQEILERAGTSLKTKFDAYNSLVRAIFKVTKTIVHLQEIHNDPQLSPEIKATAATAQTPTAVYWTIRAIVVAASQLLGITGSEPEYVTEAWELSSLAHKLENIFDHLEDILDRLHQLIWKNKEEEAFNTIARILETPHMDNSKPLRVLFYKDDQPALYDGYNKKRVDIDVLKRKVVILFITDLDVVHENEYIIVLQMYSEKLQNPTRPESQYEVVWVPITDAWTEAKYKQFESLKDSMQWHTVFLPSVVSPIVVRYIRDPRKWNFAKKPLLVVMDPQGKIVHQNAVHMMCIWGSIAFPFTNQRERLLWEEETWRIELLADAIDPNLSTWITEKKYICLYGGEDIEWIRNFTKAARNVAVEANIQLEMLYVGRSKPKENVVKNIMNIIQAEKLSHILDLNLIWFFWIRLESMWQSKGQLLSEQGKTHSPTDPLKSDPIMQGIISMLSFGSSDRGWAVISQGSPVMSRANGEHMLKSLGAFKDWKNRSSEVGFIPALNEHLEGVHRQAPHHCTSLILPATGIMPETVQCAECGRLMERFSMFRCCLD
ncbi:protein SIEVE ELEMENT OCCLUSION A-like [Pyrus x bretschneideri]|uniref:protein SIEVE ELEMENT OCCLUSION A-like n=1 Tax=Pyrus x bretschneideri TaxID=225117 RepID=UPI0020307D44|nr:protein SIEVE ELEMENT OCCLUSION A-like [Pyrus x bretschneideri]